MTGERITIDGGGTVLVLGVGDDGRLHQLALGGADAASAATPFPTALYPLALPTFGEEVLREPALRVTHADGAVGTRLVVRSVEHAEHDHGVEHRVVMADRVAPLEVALCWRTWPDHGLVEQWTEAVNRGGERIALHQLASAAPAFAGGDAHLTHWGGGWAGEWAETAEPLAPGTKTVASAGGVRPSLYGPPVVLVAPEGPATETDGAVLLVTVAWGGDVRFDAEVALHRHARLIAGTQHRGAERMLDAGERFVAPPAVLVWSGDGVGPTSRALHRWVRDHVVRDAERLRAIAFNNWEAQGFALDTAGVQEVIDGAAAVGAELFLLDDGWFGSSHPRDDDTQGLGDWTVDRAKFAEGLGPVVDHALDAGLRFGLWVEPEMVNPASELYEQHPDWVVGEPGRERREERQQLVLDVCRPEVAAHVVDVVDRVLALHEGISYLKWDANRDVFEAGSTALPPDRQSHLPIDRVRATDALMAEVARRHPDVELMLCASGGGRSDLATLRHFHELWTSDNTDPVDRVRIQWGASHLLPALVLGAHVTRWGLKPVPFACAVALSGRFGFDIDPRHLDDLERAAATDAVATYREIRPLVQQGELHRLVSPVGADVGALAYLAPGSDHGGDPGGPVAVVFAYVLAGTAADAPALEVPGLDDGQRYRVVDATPGGPDRGTEQVLTGAELAAGALDWPAGEGPVAAVRAISPDR